MCTTGRQTLIGQCPLAQSVGIASEGACVFGERIPDGSTAGVLLPIVVAGGSSSTQLALDLRLRHPDRGQLKVRVRAPNGAQLSLHDRSGAGVPDFAWCGTVRVPWTGVNGRWIVSVGDGVAGGEGTVEYVNLTAR
ncbi:MAG: proprotein convertase P-domain-containing protein [Myxococcota bacterium]|nr:proprotein convertase P-domain-containing protein [Myxococcota bacterium]